jgi:activator of HSP90 ATPase
MADIHQEISFNASPDAVYRALSDSAEHTAFTGEPAQIGADGEKWSAYGGKISGRNVELVPGKRIVQAWRAGNWGEGVYSLARFELSSDGKGTKLVFDQSGVPEDARVHIDGGWHKMYWEKLAKHLG